MKAVKRITKCRKRAASIAALIAIAAIAAIPAGAATAADASQPDAALAAKVPKFYRDRGELVVGVNPDVAPIKFIDKDGEVAGFTPDLLSAAAKMLGLKLKLTQASFDSLIPGLSANRFDVLLSLADFRARHHAVTFVDYLNMGETVLASPDRKIALKSLDELCGLQVAVPRGSGVMESGQRISEQCAKDGKKPLALATYPDSNMTLLSLTTGASEVAWVDSPAGYYNANKFPAKYKIVFFTYKAPYGIGFGVDEKGRQLAAAFQQALVRLQKDGTYDALLKKWGLAAKDAKPQFPVNGAEL